MNLINIIMPNYNGYQDTIECLESMKVTLAKSNIKVVIVDNNSTKGDVIILEKWIKKNEYAHEKEKIVFDYIQKDYINASITSSNIIILKNINNGYAGAVNTGIKFSKEIYKNVDYYWVLNNDTIIRDDTLEHLLNFSMKNKKVGMVGSTILEYHNPEIIQCAGGAVYNKYLTKSKNILSGINYEESIGKKKVNNSFKIDYISGASMFIPKKAQEKIGYFNEEYFLYYEELDYTIRLNQMRYSIAWCQESILYHKGGNSIGSKSLKNKKSELSEYYSNLSCLKFTKKFHPKIFYIVSLNRIILKCMSIIINRDFNLIRPLINSYYDFFVKKR